jgi:hypothetical protein
MTIEGLRKIIEDLPDSTPLGDLRSKYGRADIQEEFQGMQTEQKKQYSRMVNRIGEKFSILGELRHASDDYLAKLDGVGPRGVKFIRRIVEKQAK